MAPVRRGEVRVYEGIVLAGTYDTTGPERAPDNQCPLSA